MRTDPWDSGLEGHNPAQHSCGYTQPPAALGLEVLPGSSSPRRTFSPFAAPKQDQLSPSALPGPVAAPLLELSSSPLLKALGPWAGIQNIPSNRGSLQSEISSRGESKVCRLPNGSELLTLRSELLHVHTCPLYGGLPQVGDMGHRQGQARGRIHQGFSLQLRVPLPHD